MKHRYIVFLSFIVVIMFSFISFSVITTQYNSQYNNINTQDISPVTYTWSLSGNACAPSTATFGSTISLKINIASFSESSGAGSTPLCFIVDGNNVHTVDVSTTGVYTYNWNAGMNYGNINFHAKYLSCSGWVNTAPSPGHGGTTLRPLSSLSHVFSYSTFGSSTIHINKYLDYIGYDGNSSIYLSNIVHQPTYCIYGNVNITDSRGIYHGNNIANKSIIVGKTAYIESDNGKCLYISLNLTDIGAGAQSCSFDAKSGLSTCTRPYEIITDLQTSGASSDVSVQFCNNEEVGYNVTNMDSKSATEMQDEVSLIGDGFSLIPVAGYAVTGAMAAGTAYSLIHCVTTKPVKGSATDNNPADIKYCITGGSMSGDSYVKNGQNVYASGIEANIKVPNSQLNSNFKIEIEYATEYQCGSSLITAPRATTTQTINATPASAIYGTVGKTPGCDKEIDGKNYTYDPNLNSSLYIENANTHTFYNVTIKDGRFLFFAQPDTEYKVYYFDNGQLKEFKLNNKESVSSIDTGSPGSSFPEPLYE